MQYLNRLPLLMPFLFLTWPCSVTTHQVERNQENKQLSIASQWHMAIVKLWLQRVTCTTRMNGWLLLLALLLVRNKGKIRYTFCQVIAGSLHCKKVWVTLTIFWLVQLHSFCVCDINSKECLQFEQSVVQKLSSPFRRLIAFLVRLMFL